MQSRASPASKGQEGLLSGGRSVEDQWEIGGRSARDWREIGGRSAGGERFEVVGRCLLPRAQPPHRAAARGCDERPADEPRGGGDEVHPGPRAEPLALEEDDGGEGQAEGEPRDGRVPAKGFGWFGFGLVWFGLGLGLGLVWVWLG